jgi:hypothetical protein
MAQPEQHGRQDVSTNVVTITIGRNIGHEPASDEEWQRFRSAIEWELEVIYKGTIYVRGNEGSGEWEEEDGTKVTETNAVFVAEVRAEVTWGIEHVALPQIAYEFKQDAIGYAVGRGTLVKPQEAVL